ADDSVAILPPASAAGLDAGDTASVEFEIRRTGAEIGDLSLTASVPGRQLSDGAAVDAVSPAPVTIRAQRAASVSVDSLVPVTVRAGRANAGQYIPLRIVLRNGGDAAATRVALALHANGATPVDTVLVTTVAGGTAAFSQPTLRLRADAGPVGFDVA